jgi:hypothetical protein
MNGLTTLLHTDDDTCNYMLLPVWVDGVKRSNRSLSVCVKHILPINEYRSQRQSTPSLKNVDFSTSGRSA